METSSATVYEFGEFRLDPANQRLTRHDGTPVPMTPRVFDTLVFMVEHQGAVLDKERLMEAVWPDSIVEENNLTQNISTLRRIFGDTTGSHRFIVTVPGRGYRFVPEVRIQEVDGGPAPPTIPATAIKPPESHAERAAPLSQPDHPATSRGFRPILLATAAALALSVAALFFWRDRTPNSAPSLAPARSATIAVPENSIAVLPFANLSADQENAFFAEGIQDDILTALAKIAQLKVIARTSVMTYPAGPTRDLREIGQALAVAKILEGSVRRAGGKVRVTVQLIDTRTNTHVWAETYDRDLADVFAIQSEIARQIATQLQAKLSPNEKAAIEERPTRDLVAYDLYLRAKVFYASGLSSSKGQDSLEEAVRLLDQAVTRDPGFFLAYCQLARAHDLLYFLGADHTPARLAAADSAIAAAVRLRPDSGEVHLASAWHLYHGYRDYDHARAELALAQRTLPNAPTIFELLGLVGRRQGRWEESTLSLEKAVDLDPGNKSLLGNLWDNYYLLRRLAEAAATADRILKLVPHDAVSQVGRAYIDLQWRADSKPLHETIEGIVTENPAAAADIADDWLYLALCERDPVAANRALAAMKLGVIAVGTARLPRAWFEGVAAHARGDVAAARNAFAAARLEAEHMAREQPDYGPPLAVLGMIDAALGRKEEAMGEGRRAVELLPVEKDAPAGAYMMELLAIIYAWTGEKDLAIEQVAATLKIPGSLQY
ncbi:MAG: winged helix-turn-helix domain-containing protein, partial [Verrucomicrobiota bacterium]|nr:winged helix-turn-helix domain-containing protein [Verrucomicrobiota bacterium]